MTGAAGGAGRQRAGQKRPELLSVRLDERTKAALEAEAARKQWTVSREAAWRLDRSLVDQAAIEEGFGDSPTRGLAALVALLSRGVAFQTGLPWASDPYTFREFAAGLTLLVEGLRWLLNLYPQRPSGETLPLRVRQRYPTPAEMPPPGDLGAQIARGLLDALPLFAGPPPPQERAPFFAREFFEFPRIYRDLGLGSVHGAPPVHNATSKQRRKNRVVTPEPTPALAAPRPRRGASRDRRA